MILRDKDKNHLISIAKQVITTPCEILAYGSRVDGTAHDTSDLDIVIRSSQSAPLLLEELINFKESIQNSNIPILVQVMDWNRIPESFHKNILQKNETLWRTWG